jgi:hypothetical protein
LQQLLYVLYSERPSDNDGMETQLHRTIALRTLVLGYFATTNIAYYVIIYSGAVDVGSFIIVLLWKKRINSRSAILSDEFGRRDVLMNVLSKEDL